MTRTSIDVSNLPSFGFSHRSLMWWGTLGIIAVEGTVFALAIFAYLYIRMHVDEWPPGVAAPELLWGTVNSAIVLISLLPNQKAKVAAERFDRRGVCLWMSLALLFAVAFLVVRILEFGSLNVRWDTNAYGSAVWLLLGLHTVHLLTGTYDSLVLDVLMFTGPLEGKRYVDVSENALYWYFVVLAWVPIYGIVYIAPRYL